MVVGFGARGRGLEEVDCVHGGVEDWAGERAAEAVVALEEDLWPKCSVSI